MGFPNIKGYLLGGPYAQDARICGSIFRFPNLGKLLI